MFVKGTLYLCLVCEKREASIMLIGYNYINYDGDPYDKKIIAKMACFLGTLLIFGCLINKKTVALSSCEDE